MEKKKVILFTAASIVGAYLLGLLVLWLIVKIKNSGISGGNDDDENDGGGEKESTIGDVLRSTDFPMQRGSNHENKKKNSGVWALQIICRKFGYTSSPKLDGIWGKGTETDVDALVNTYNKTAGAKIYPFRDYFSRRSDADAQHHIWKMNQEEYQILAKWWNKYKDTIDVSRYHLDDDAHITFNN